MRQKKNGGGYVKTSFIGVKLGPIEDNYIEFLSQELPKTLGHPNGTMTKSDVIRYLIKTQVHEILKGSGLTEDQINEHILKHNGSRRRERLTF